MRISDWSSDVCSSDLVLLVVPDSQYIFGILFVNRVPFPFLVRIKLDTNGSVRPCCIDRQQGYSGCACSLCYSGHIEHISRGAFVGLMTDGEIHVLCRSEEHTSELQSLMRISYAVFCLKKKQSNYHKL